MMQRGIAVIYQEPSLADHLTTAENIFMGRLPSNRFRLIDWKRLADDTAVLSRRLGLALDPRRRSDSSAWRDVRWSRSPRRCPATPG